MERIRQRAFECAARDTGLAALAVLAAMYFVSPDPIMALKAGAIGFALVAIFVLERARRAERSAPEETEVWHCLRRDERPPRTVARPMIASAASQAGRTFAFYASGTSLTLFALKIGAIAAGFVSA
jgi:hypothetical protein